MSGEWTGGVDGEDSRLVRYGWLCTFQNLQLSAKATGVPLSHRNGDR